MNDERDCLNYLISYYHKQVQNNNFENIHFPISPLYVGFKITEKCNQNCKHCWAGKSEVIKSYEEIQNAMEKIATFKIMHFTITGGEPLEHANFFEILKKSIELFPIVEVFSNGQDLTEETIRKVSIYFRKADFFQISLDGMRDAYKIQRGVDSFDKVIANIKLMKKYDINIRLHMTVTDINVNDIISVYNLANKLKVNVFSITPVYDLRRGKQFRNIELLDQYEKTIKYLRELNSTDDSNVILRIFMPLEIKSKTAKYVKESRKEYLFLMIMYYIGR